VFRPAGAKSTVPFSEIGHLSTGAWGIVEAEPYLAAVAEDVFELLYISPREYGSAMRDLEGDDVALAVERRRARYAALLPTLALGTVEGLVRRCIRAAPGEDASARSGLLEALASFTTLSRFAHTPASDLVDYLREGDAELATELESPSLRGPAGIAGLEEEGEIRRRFAQGLGQLAATWGQPEKAQALPYFDVRRVYLISPAAPSVEERAHVLREPFRRWRGGTVVALPERLSKGVEEQGHRLQVLFASPAQFTRALAELTPAQLEAELVRRTSSPEYAAHLNARRVQQATLRVTAHMLAGADAELGPVLAEQIRQEEDRLGAWLSPEATDPAPLDLAAEMTEAIGAARLLAALCRRRQRESVADRIEAFGRALGQVLAEGGA
jgi:hypothetical protein